MSSSFFTPSRECRISAPANIADNFRAMRSASRHALGAPRRSFFSTDGVSPHDAHHSTILFKGYSTIPGLGAFSSAESAGPRFLDDGIYGDPSGSLKVEIVAS